MRLSATVYNSNFFSYSIVLTFSLSVVCPAGSFYSDGKCDACPRGSYQAEAGQEFCTPCPSGTSTAAQGASSPSHCE